MALDEKSEVWFRKYSHKYPWVHDIIEKYGLDLSLYNLNHESNWSFIKPIDRANLIEDVHFLKTFDEYVKERLPQNFSNVLEVGTGNWTYVSALTTFFRKYNDQVHLIGIDKDPYYVDKSTESIQNRNVKGVETALGDINNWSEKSDIVVNICSNLTDNGDLYIDINKYQSAIDYVHSLWKTTSEDGLLIVGLTYTGPTEESMKTFLKSHFKDIDINENKYSTNKSTYPLLYLITAKPKLPIEIELNQNKL